MERAAWTDERLDDLSNRMDAGFARLEAEIRELRGDLHRAIGGLRAELRAELRGEIGGLREEMHAEIGGLREEIGGLRAELRGEIADLRLTLLRVGGGMMVGLVGVIGAVLVSA